MPHTYDENYEDERAFDDGEPGKRYPAWWNAWTARLGDIDDQLVDYFNSATLQAAESMDALSGRIAGWFDRQEIGPEASAQWAKVKSDARLLTAQLENRITHLVQNGRIRAARSRRDMRR